MEGKPLNVFLDLSGTLTVHSNPKEALLALQEGLKKAGYSPTFYIYSMDPKKKIEDFVEKSGLQEVIKDTFSGLDDHFKTQGRLKKIDIPKASFVVIDDKKDSGQTKLEAILLSHGEVSENIEDKRVIPYKGGDFCDYIPEITNAVGGKVLHEESKKPTPSQTFPQNKGSLPLADGKAQKTQ